MRLFVKLILQFVLLLLGIKVGLAEGPPKKIDLPVPIGHVVKGLRVPLRNAQGKMDMLFDMASARRIDDKNVEMSNSVIQTYDQQTGKPDAKIELHSAVMNLDQNVITSKEHVTVSRIDFRLTGDGLVFNSKTRHGTVTGNIDMRIFNRQELQSNNKKDQAPKEPTKK
jgi:hypothetical protein